MKNKHFPNISYTLTHSLCTGCGICEGACPSHAIRMEVSGGRFVPRIDDSLCKNAKGCHRCHDACAGLGINLVQTAKENLTFEGTKHDDFVGNYLSCFTGHSTDEYIRYHSASGGMVSQMLIWLLEKGYIQGAVVTKFDPDNELLVKSFVATTKEEILAAKSSKYSPVTLNTAIEEIKKHEGKFVIVGMPCHIQGFRKYEQLDKRFKEKIFGYFGIYCSCGRTFYLTEYAFRERGIDKSRLTYFAYRDEGCLGSMVARQRPTGIRIASNSETCLCKEDEVYKDRYQNYYHPLRTFFVPKRCHFCIDHYAELADVSFGDIHVAPYKDDKIGISSWVIRNEKFVQLFEQAKKDGTIVMDDLEVENLKASQKVAFHKKRRSTTYLKLHRLLGHKVPCYDVALPDNHPLKSVVAYFNQMAQGFIGRRKWLWWIIKPLKMAPPQD